MIRIGLVAIVFALAVFGTAGCVGIMPVPIPVPVPVRGFSLIPPIVDPLGAGEPAVPTGPGLSSVASLPVDASGEGTISGVPTGEGDSSPARGTFELVLVPAPPGLAPRTTVHVGLDHSTKAYRNGEDLGDPLAAMDSDNDPMDADPTGAGTVTVRFHIKDGRVFADRLDLSDDSPP